MGEPRTESELSAFDDDYQVIRFSVGWGSLSIVAFLITVAVIVIVNDLQWIAYTVPLSVAGLVFGLIGLKSGRGSRGAARTGTFLNGVVVGMFLLIAFARAAFLVLRRLG